MIEILDHLKSQVFKLSQQTDSEWSDFSSKWKLKFYKKNDFIIKSGQIEKYFYFVHAGVQRAFVVNNGNEVSIGFSYTGDFSGGYESFLAQKPGDWNIQALTDSTVIRISFLDLMEMYDKYKSVERWGRKFNAQMLIGMGKRQIEVRNYNAEQRFERLFNQSPHIFQLVPQKYLASYLGLTPETFSRLRKKFTEKRD